MERVHFRILILSIFVFLLSSASFSQDYVHYKTLTGHTDGVVSLAFSPDGQTLASAGEDDIISLWDVNIGVRKKTFYGHKDYVSGVAFSPDGHLLASTSGDRTMRLWDVNTGQNKTTISSVWHVSDVAFSPDGRLLANGGWSLHVRDVETGKLKQFEEHSVFSVAFSPDGCLLASGKGDGTIRLRDVDAAKHRKSLIGHTGMVNSVSFSPDGETLASSSWDGTIRLWDVTAGLCKYTLTLGPSRSLLGDVKFSPDGQLIASVDGNRRIRLFDVATGRHKETFTKDDLVYSVAFSPDGRLLASGGLGTVQLWKLSTPQPIRTTPSTLPKPTANQVYEKAIRSVMWIVNPGIGEGSGVLIDKKFKLVVTNAHVADKQNTIDVYFPAPDEKGELIKDRNFYLTNGGVLKRLGYYTKGHVIAKNEKTDLAIIRLDGLPETAREIDWNFTPPKTKAGELVYILGNPAKQELWRWTLGEFLNDHGDFLHIQSDVFGGNSGGPVLNKQGILIGIVARSDQLMNAAAIPARHISRLLSESKVKHARTRR